MQKAISSILIILTSGILFTGLTAQPTIEVDYYKPFESAGGGYLEENISYRLRCNAVRSLFMFLTQENIESSEEDGNGGFEVSIWLGEEEHWLFKDYAIREVTESLTSIQENRYVIDDQLHPMKWEISGETKNIEGISVTKARCAHRGRWYTAWFAPAIPISNGPWKLGGLPGLILEAYDDEKEVVFLFKSLKQIGNLPISLPPSKGRKVSLETYLELNEKETKQYFEFIEARMKSTSGDVDIDFNMKFTSWESLK